MLALSTDSGTDVALVSIIIAAIVVVAVCVVGVALCRFKNRRKLRRSMYDVNTNATQESQGDTADVTVNTSASGTRPTKHSTSGFPDAVLVHNTNVVTDTENDVIASANGVSRAPVDNDVSSAEVEGTNIDFDGRT